MHSVSSFLKNFCTFLIYIFTYHISIYIFLWYTQGDPPKIEPINFFITSTKIKQNNSNFVHSNFWTWWWILWSQLFMHRIYFISWKKEKAWIKFMNFCQKYMGSVFFCVTLYIYNSIYISIYIYIYIYLYISIYICYYYRDCVSVTEITSPLTS